MKKKQGIAIWTIRGNFQWYELSLIGILWMKPRAIKTHNRAALKGNQLLGEWLIFFWRKSIYHLLIYRSHPFESCRAIWLRMYCICHDDRNFRLAYFMTAFHEGLHFSWLPHIYLWISQIVTFFISILLFSLIPPYAWFNATVIQSWKYTGTIIVEQIFISTFQAVSSNTHSSGT